MMLRPKKRELPKPGDCFFCKAKATPDYKDKATLGRFVSDRGKILPRGRSGLCSKHQRQLSVAVKRARYLALVPFAAKI